MTETGWLVFLRNISIICNVIGLLIALSFLFGPKVLITVSKIMDRLRPTVELEKVLETRARVILGLTLLVITVLMLALVTSIRV
ncbi:MAG: hypothetical protein ABIH40_05070 [Candidatus Omnitrophota bacterium]